MKIKISAFAIAALLSISAQAVTVAQWDFNAGTTKHSISMNGASFETLGGITIASTFPTDSGSSDTGTPTVGGGALNTATYGTATSGNLSRGVQFSIDTSGYENLLFSFDQRNSSTASAYTALFYTLDGAQWSLATSFRYTPTNASFVNGISYDFSGISGANDNANFGLRLVSMFAPGSSSYTGSGGTYSSNGTIRYDMVTLSGSEVAAPVPESSSLAMLMAGLGVVGLMVRRRAA